MREVLAFPSSVDQAPPVRRSNPKPNTCSAIKNTQRSKSGVLGRCVDRVWTALGLTVAIVSSVVVAPFLFTFLLALGAAMLLYRSTRAYLVAIGYAIGIFIWPITLGAAILSKLLTSYRVFCHHRKKGFGLAMKNAVYFYYPQCLEDLSMLYRKLISYRNAPSSASAVLVPIVSVEEDKRPCTCEKCHRSLRTDDGCKHSTIKMTKLARNCLGYNVVDPPTLSTACKYDSMHLLRKSIEYFDKPSYKMNNLQLSAIERFEEVVAAWEDEPDWRCCLSIKNAESILHALNDIYFLSAIPRLEFNWCAADVVDRLGAVYLAADGTVRIEAHPLHYYRPAYQPTPAYGRKEDRLGTLFHECLHGYIQSLSCLSCPMAPHNVGREGHGRAFVILGAKMQEAAPKLLKCRPTIYSFDDLKSQMEFTKALPSNCDLKNYAFDVRKESRLFMERLGEVVGAEEETGCDEEQADLTR